MVTSTESCIGTVSTSLALQLGNGEGFGLGCMTYFPAGTSTINVPSAFELNFFTVLVRSAVNSINCVARGFGAHCGSLGIRSTGHTGPSSTFPTILPHDSATGSSTIGHSANAHDGAIRPTEEPSGHIFASLVHPAGTSTGLGTVVLELVVVVACISPHFANSHKGPERPTAEPSGHIIASIVHPISFGF
jgi:hypothetical protein